MSSIDAMLQELYQTGKEVSNNLEANGRLSLAMQVRLQEVLGRAERWLADNKDNKDNGNKGGAPKVKASKGKFYLMKHLVDLMKPYLPARCRLPILNAIHIDGKTAWATNLGDMVVVKLHKGDLGPDCSIPASGFKQLESAALAGLVDNVKTAYSSFKTNLLDYKYKQGITLFGFQQISATNRFEIR